MIPMPVIVSTSPSPSSMPSPTPTGRSWAWAVLAVACGLAGLAWWVLPSSPTPPPADATVTELIPGTVATMDSAPFAFSPGWHVTADGADPPEPADPWQTPAGSLHFVYTGSELALQLAVGDYWGYLYVTVDGRPANGLAAIRGNLNSRGEQAGYRTLYAPETQTDSGPTPQWVVVHTATTPGPHRVAVEVWRGWGQTPLTAVAIDSLPVSRPRWPAAAFWIAGGWAAVAAWRGLRSAPTRPERNTPPAFLTPLLRPLARPRLRWAAAGSAVMLLAAAIALGLWWLALPGLALLGYAATAQPSLWVGALLLALPFYFSQTLPLLPGRATNLVEIGLLGGLGVVGLHRLWIAPPPPDRGLSPVIQRWAQRLGWVLAALVSWALVAAGAAEHLAPALREWRTVFLAGGLFALLLHWVLGLGTQNDRHLLVAAWPAGATVVAVIGLAQFASGVSLIEAEGVQRIRAFYGSPNNLALYLERTLMVTLALALLTSGRLRWITFAAAAIQGAALLLTFSKGSLLLGLPAGLLVLWLGGWWVLRARGASRRPLWWIAAAVGVGVILLLPFLGTDRFRGLLDFSQGTGRLRLLLWRSAWQMALDHPWLGVGPDNFLYALRSVYLLPDGWQEPNLNHPHNWPLDWWTRLGLPGLVLGTAFFVNGCALVWMRLTGAAAASRTDAALWLGLLAASAAGLVHGLIDLSYATPDLMLVWVLIFFLAASAPQDPP